MYICILCEISVFLWRSGVAPSMCIHTYMHPRVHVDAIMHYTNVHMHSMRDTGWRRVIGCLILIGHFPHKSPVLVANLRKVIYEIRHPVRLRHPVSVLLQLWCNFIYMYTHTYTHPKVHIDPIMNDTMCIYILCEISVLLRHCCMNPSIYTRTHAGIQEYM